MVWLLNRSTDDTAASLFMLESQLLVLLVVLRVLFLPAFMASLGVIRPGPWGLRGLTPKIG